MNNKLLIIPILFLFIYSCIDSSQKTNIIIPSKKPEIKIPEADNKNPKNENNVNLPKEEKSKQDTDNNVNKSQSSQNNESNVSVGGDTSHLNYLSGKIKEDIFPKSTPIPSTIDDKPYKNESGIIIEGKLKE